MNITFTAALAYAVLIPGSGSSGDRIWLNNLNWVTPLLGGDRYFGKIQDELGHAALPTYVCPSDQDEDRRTIEERAAKCVADILLHEPRGCGDGASRHVHLLGHSMGGLIARTVAQDPRVQGCVSSVTTVSTPNQGSPIADWAIDHAENDETTFDIFGKIVKLIDFVPTSLHYLPQLRVERKGYPEGTFRAQDLSDNPDVKYFSFTSSMKKIPIAPLEAARKILSKEIIERGLDQTPYGDANDGIVPEYSMVHGTNLGHLDAHHWASACVDPVKRTKECKNAAKAIESHLLKIAGR